MVNKIFNEETYLALRKALDSASLQQKAITKTEKSPTKRADITFAEELKNALEQQTLKTTTTNFKQDVLGELISQKIKTMQKK